MIVKVKFANGNTVLSPTPVSRQFEYMVNTKGTTFIGDIPYPGVIDCPMFNGGKEVITSISVYEGGHLIDHVSLEDLKG
jgi:hypothetical protein